MSAENLPATASPSLLTILQNRSNTNSAKLSLQETYIENTGLESVLGKREIFTYRPEIKLTIALLSEELFQLKIKQKMLLRKESELDYLLQDAILQEEYHRRTEEINHHFSALSRQDGDQVDDIVRIKEFRLFQETKEITDIRNNLLMDLDVERLREEEEDKEILEEYHALKQVWQRLRQSLHTSNSQDMLRMPDCHDSATKSNLKNKSDSGPKSEREPRKGCRKRKLGKIECVLF